MTRSKQVGFQVGKGKVYIGNDEIKSLGIVYAPESERYGFAHKAEQAVPKPPDFLRLGEFHPHWDQGYPSYHDDRRALWRRIVADAIQETHLRPEDLQAHSDVRNPSFHKQDWSENTILYWHCDNHVRLGSNTPNANQWMVVWANCKPTELRAPNGVITQGDPYELIAFRNGAYEHRMPALTAEEANRRWFARQCIEVPVPVSEYDSWNGHQMRNIVYNPGMYVTQKNDALLDEMLKYMAKPIDRELLKKRYPEWFITSEA